MATVETINFSSVPLDTLGALPLTTYSGSLTVDYDTGTVTGTLSVAPALGISATTYNSFTLTPNGTGGYTINGTGQTASLVNSTISIQYNGVAPTSVNTQYYAGGVEAASGTGGSVTSAPCFAAGTLIRTIRGDIAVEDLQVGDRAVTASGAARPIRWLGHRTVDCRRHASPLDVLPIRIAADAFGAGRPARDLFVSPGHSICADVLGEVLIPACALLNGSTVQQIEVDEITYWHVELDSHDILLAENLPAESYLDMGNRGFFPGADVVDLAAGPDADPAARTHADFCRPFHASGPVVEAVKAQLRKRAQDRGWALSTGIEMHLVVDGVRLDPAIRGLNARFHVPAGATDVWLVSPTARPCDTMATRDSRDLGLYLSTLRIEDGWSEPHTVAVDDPMLCVGFHEVEDGARRWTTGRARLPAALWEGRDDGFFLRVDLAALPVQRWTAPDAATSQQPRLAIVA